MLLKDSYTIAIWSEIRLQPEIVYEVLRLPSIRRLVFPARLYTAPRKAIELERPEQFSLDLLPKAFVRKELLMVPLDGINGLELSLTIYNRKETVVPHSFNLQIPLEAARAGTINWQDMKQVFVEVVPLFQSNQGRVIYYGANKDETVLYGEPKGYNVHLRLGWLSYYGPKALEILGRGRFDRLVTCKEKMDLAEGILIVLQEEPLDMTNPEHVGRKRQAEHELGFDDLEKDERLVWRQQPIRSSP
jgi:hypothetical protein